MQFREGLDNDKGMDTHANIFDVCVVSRRCTSDNHVYFPNRLHLCKLIIRCVQLFFFKRKTYLVNVVLVHYFVQCRENSIHVTDGL